MTSEMPAADAALFRALRRTWEAVDPVPADLVDRMVAAVATADLSREYALLTLVESDRLAAVRGDADMLTLQFSDGTTNVLIHVTAAESGARRIDGWVDGDALRVELVQDRATFPTVPEGGRFAFDDVPAGVSRLRILLAASPVPGTAADVVTPRFEV
ncbi:MULTISPECIES: hypothetical protein [Microbacterium]|uniref:Uncharacterized protein n=1 Tax=Microbacterium saccharophilum TaxID=1213358 RepID=A0A7Z7D2H5_9MICO|nr:MULTISPECIES: hypothetical protein [Microbacterium]GEP47008.1 hypothetical protein MSA03_05160 [Microbacterium saccharophilum]SFI57852.1 hypothetical protein SAMN04487751_2213 [Microbacterium saccharophilum]